MKLHWRVKLRTLTWNNIKMPLPYSSVSFIWALMLSLGSNFLDWVIYLIFVQTERLDQYIFQSSHHRCTLVTIFMQIICRQVFRFSELKIFNLPQSHSITCKASLFKRWNEFSRFVCWYCNLSDFYNNVQISLNSVILSYCVEFILWQ